MLDTVMRLSLVTLCFVSLGSYARRRAPIHRDAAVMLGGLVAISVIALAYRATNFSDELLREFGSVLFLVQPALLLRLVAHFHSVPRAITAVAVAGVAFVAAVVIGRDPSLTTSLGLGIIAWFVYLQVYCVIAFTRSARSSRGAARHQMSAVAAGAVLFGMTLFVLAAMQGPHTHPVPGAAALSRMVLEIMLLLVGVLFFCGFTPPAWLRRRWQVPDVYAFVTRATAEFHSVESTLRSLVRSALQVTGARVAVIALPRQDVPGLGLRWWGAERAASSTEVLMEPLDGPFARAWIEGQSAATHTRGLGAPVTGRLAEEVGARDVLVVPIGGSGAAPKRLGLLALFTDSGWLFPDADLALVEIMASHAAVVLTTQQLLAETAAAAERLQQANDALDAADRAKNDFLATLAHELRNPLTPVRMGLGLLRARRNNPAAFERMVKMMEDEVTRMAHLIDDLIDISRITRNKIELQWKRVDLAQIVCEAAETAQTYCEPAGQSLTVELPPHPVWLQADPVRVAQIVSNLLNNASKYTQEGGSISVSVAREAGHAVVSIRDNGRGIPEDMLARIFEMFVQGNPAAGGLGIGLTLVRRLVNLHGGTVEAASAGPGAGSVFTVRLPAAAELPDGGGQAAGPVGGDAARRGRGRRILVVDDNRAAVEMLAELLTLDGYAVCTAFDGIGALEAGEAFRPEVVVMDLSMPTLNGYEAASQMRQQTWGRSATFIALTGLDQEKDRRRAQEVGFDRHLTKPVDPGELLALLGTPWP